MNEHPNGLRDAISAYFDQQTAEWELRVQLCRDLDAMPIEDASVPWPEDASPFMAVARIRCPVQQAWSHARSVAIDDGMAFNPWHGLAAHRPLGSIMRGRKVIYDAMSRARANLNKVAISEPTQLPRF